MPELQLTSAIATPARPPALATLLSAPDQASLSRVDPKTVFAALWGGDNPEVIHLRRRLRFDPDPVLMWLPNQRAVLNSERNSG